MKKNENLLHIKLESNEAVQSLKDVLNTEVDMIKIVQSIRRYRALRLKELELKIQLHEKIKKFRTDVQKVKTILPKLEIPKILKKHESEMHRTRVIEEAEKVLETEKPEKKLNEIIKKIKKEKEVKPQKPPVDDLEAQLMEIQEKLRRLE